MNIIPETKVFIDGIKPVKAEIFYEDGEPFIKYEGRAWTCDTEYKIVVPKMSLQIDAITQEELELCASSTELELCASSTVRFTQAVYSVGTEQVAVKFIPIKRKMTKKQIENELGYAIEIREA